MEKQVQMLTARCTGKCHLCDKVEACVIESYEHLKLEVYAPRACSTPDRCKQRDKAECE